MMPLNQKVVCPSCWDQFSPADSLWISAHPDLYGDERLGEDFQKRFLPERFTVKGSAIDAKGTICQELACPNCHLPFPRSSLELSSFFISIAGTPSCGKSYFLASMTWTLRQLLPRYFASSFADSDSIWNKILNDYEEQQFFNPEHDRVVRLAKTEEQGDLYSIVTYNEQSITYPKPFLFDLRPLDQHPNAGHRQKVSRQICIYDNAGESFQPGKDSVVNAVTKHLGISECWMFCFDPSQDPRFRSACKEHDTQLAPIGSEVTSRQETIFHEMVKRIRRHAQLGEHDKTKRPIIIVCTKYDAWWPLLAERLKQNPFGGEPTNLSVAYAPSRLDAKVLRSPIHESQTTDLGIVDLEIIEWISQNVRALLYEYAADLVTAAESFSNSVYFVPVSATGDSVELDEETGKYGVRPKNIKPMWCEVPFLIALCHRASGLIPYRKA